MVEFEKSNHPAPGVLEMLAVAFGIFPQRSSESPRWQSNLERVLASQEGKQMQISSPSAPSSIRFHLLRLVAASVLPVWLLACLLVYHAYVTKCDQVNKKMLETVRTMTQVVDRELTGIQASLQALATSPSFASGNLADVQRQALLILKSYPGADIVVSDETGQQLVNTSRAFGSPLPKRGTPETVRRIFETARPAFSGLYTGALTKQPQISIDVPVLENGRVLYDLALTIRSDPMAEILLRTSLPPDWYGLILDSRNILIARSLNSERSLGGMMPAPLRRALQLTPEGTAESKSLEDEPVLVNFSRSELSNWRIVIEVPKSSVMSSIYQWVGWAMLGATTISLIGIALALGYARKIARAIQSLVEPALSLGGAEMIVAVGSYSVKETGEVAAALVQAFDLLQARAAERDQAEIELVQTVEDLEREAKERLEVLEKLSEKDVLLLHQGRQAAMGEMIGNIAHQWRQPLSALGLLIQQMPLNFQRGGFDKKYLDDCVRKSMGLIHQMSGTIDDFRNFFKTDKEKVKFRVKVEVKRALLLLEGCLAKQPISIEVDAKDDPYIFGYPNEFSQVLLNILINAKDEFAKKSIADPRVVITLCGENGRAVVTIADNAGGVPEEIIGKIFDPYFTTKEPQSGTGVGLFMSKTIIEKNMGGSLRVRNNGSGAEFSIEF
jgi:signal transduction histidine kinase